MSVFSAYYAVFVPSDNKYSVFFPDLPGCLPWGDTFEAAFADALEALEAHLYGMAEDGDDIPPPSSREAAWTRFTNDWAAMGKEMSDDMQMQLVPAPPVEAAPVRVNVSFRKSDLTMIDRKADAAGMTRSGFLSRAAEAYHP